VDLAAHRPSAILGDRESFLAHHFGQIYLIEITRGRSTTFKGFTSKNILPNSRSLRRTQESPTGLEALSYGFSDTRRFFVSEPDLSVLELPGEVDVSASPRP
jgi:hypothetical protein